MDARAQLLAHDCAASITVLVPFDHSAAHTFHESYPDLMRRLARVVRKQTEIYKWRTMSFLPGDHLFLRDKMHLTRRGRMEFAAAICAAAGVPRDASRVGTPSSCFGYSM